MADVELSKMDQEFVTTAAEDGLVEMELAKLAQKKAQSDELRDFATKLQQDHGQMHKKLMEVAKKLGVDLPSTISTKHRELLDEMAAYSGDDFDEQFLATVVDEHSKDMNLYHGEQEHGRNEDLKKLAAETVPLLQRHFDMAKSLHGRA